MEGEVIAISRRDVGPGPPYRPAWWESYLLHDSGKFYTSGGVGRQGITVERAIEFVGSAQMVRGERFAALVQQQPLLREGEEQQ